ncbi:maleylacetate reductase [Undibacterium terreum]|uniref:maleylacetate reductase n=1 Tax=Undibacterium terreum TaxID=1224302 RepID=A0A916UVU1_9BURK|nr:maleylacetate reductase [Undibacterium terreum]GGC90961.1 maleylacetate reductase [Undibacterium terreum]
MQNFIYSGSSSRIVFGASSLQHLVREVEALGAQRALVLCTPRQREGAQRIAELLGNRCAGIFDGAVMHVPIEVARQAREHAQALNADCAIAVGGGSTIGLGKAIALESSLPILAIPTTYAGSEMTPIYGITEAGLKKTGRDARVLPKTVIYDPELSLDLPAQISATSGINAIAHAAEGLYAHDGNPITSLMAQEGIRALAQALPQLMDAPHELEARSAALYGAWLCGSVLGSVSMGLHHKLCHTLGGSYGLPHAETHTIVLPHALHYNAQAAPVAMQRIGDALGASGAAQGVYDLALSLKVPMSLKEIGMPEAELDRCSEIATQNAYANPRPIEKAAIRALLEYAYHGRRPGM